jgi:sugar lactone lactonase YvrE
MYKPHLRIRETRGLPAALGVLMSCLWLPAARGDIFVSQGASGFAYSYSEFTGASHVFFNANPSGCGIDVHCPPAFTTGVAIGPDGNLYVADLNNEEIVGFNASTGVPTGALIGMGPKPDVLSAPYGITFGPGGNLYVADNLGYIWFFGGPPSFTPIGIGKFPCTPPASGTPCNPLGLTFGPDGNLYVSDVGSGGVLQFSVSGNTLTFLSQFVPRPNPTAYPNAYPGGLHFSPGPNGNLYVSFAVPILGTGWYYNDIFEYNGPNSGSPGSPVALDGGAGIAYWGQQDFAFGPSGGIIAAEAYAFNEYSPSTGYWLSQFGALALPPGEIAAGFITIGPCSFCVAPPLTLFPAIGLDSSQNLRLSVIEGPVWVPPGVPVQVQLGFENSQGAPVGPSQVVTLNPGQTASLDLDASTLISSGRIEIQPVVTAAPGAPAPMAIINGSAEVYNATYGFGSAFYAGVPATGGSGATGPPSFLPQGVALGQSIQVNAGAPPDSPCVAMLSFTDDNGNPVGPTQQVNLSPGQLASLTFNPNKYTKSGRQEYVPQITPNNPTGGQGVAPACLGSAEVYVTKTGSTSTYQTSSPAVGTMPPAP